MVASGLANLLTTTKFSVDLAATGAADATLPRDDSDRMSARDEPPGYEAACAAEGSDVVDRHEPESLNEKAAPRADAVSKPASLSKQPCDVPQEVEDDPEIPGRRREDVNDQASSSTSDVVPVMSYWSRQGSQESPTRCLILQVLLYPC